eukprot:TRINITY_DN2101_c0_g1_i1.p1 TRINITY_DN2101_c0_g1~~TRINITY_DN2101_c0_g1_i1.p1  ORF type:complete len:368 (-),score=57.40 TRINITY_DN2101_c0_g1_i1:69-1172(-)
MIPRISGDYFKAQMWENSFKECIRFSSRSIVCKWMDTEFSQNREGFHKWNNFVASKPTTEELPTYSFSTLVNLLSIGIQLLLGASEHVNTELAIEYENCLSLILAYLYESNVEMWNSKDVGDIIAVAFSTWLAHIYVRNPKLPKMLPDHPTWDIDLVLFEIIRISAHRSLFSSQVYNVMRILCLCKASGSDTIVNTINNVIEDVFDVSIDQGMNSALGSWNLVMYYLCVCKFLSETYHDILTRFHKQIEIRLYVEPARDSLSLRSYYGSKAWLMMLKEHRIEALQLAYQVFEDFELGIPQHVPHHDGIGFVLAFGVLLMYGEVQLATKYYYDYVQFIFPDKNLLFWILGDLSSLWTERLNQFDVNNV